MRINLALIAATMLVPAALAVSAAPAAAADLARPMAPAPTMYTSPVAMWSGAYLGVHVGYLWGDADSNNSAMGGTSADIDGIIGGVQIGYNWQYQQFVYGVEADFSLSGADGSGAYASGEGLSGEISWLGTLRGRVGYAFDNVLVYGTGGLAFGDVEAKSYGFGSPNYSSSETKFGYALGAGVEYAINRNWSAKIEYMYYDLGDVSFNFFDPGGKVDFTASTVKFGINYKF